MDRRAGYAWCWPAHEARRRLGVKELTVRHGACAVMGQARRRQSASRASGQAGRAASRARTSSSPRATSRRGALVAWAVGGVAASADGSSATDGWAGAAPAGELVIPRSRAAGQQCDEPDKGRLVVGRSMVLGWSSRRTAGHRGALSWTAPFAGYRRVRLPRPPERSGSRPGPEPARMIVRGPRGAPATHLNGASLRADRAPRLASTSPSSED